MPLGGFVTIPDFRNPPQWRSFFLLSMRISRNILGSNYWEGRAPAPGRIPAHDPVRMKLDASLGTLRARPPLGFVAGMILRADCPMRFQAARRQIGRPSSNMRLSALTAIFTSPCLRLERAFRPLHLVPTQAAFSGYSIESGYTRHLDKAHRPFIYSTSASRSASDRPALL